ncbi:hypothetical protein C1H46_016136 [Malus baccata]|uniref:WAT1-related protein n=1 Tax=Malus baccata TaxID=106549 RepID=A0A540MHR7_MALBA|nr:hypothetical protein C1H46_016136 [Malus baccata]
MPLAQASLSFGAKFLPVQFTVCLQSVVPALAYFILLIFRTQSISIRKKSDQPRLEALIITFGGAFLIGKYNGPTNAAHQVLYEKWTWPLCLLVASVLCLVCHMAIVSSSRFSIVLGLPQCTHGKNVIVLDHKENIMEKYDIEALWLATIVRFSTMIPSLVIALATTHGRAYKWVMGWDFNTFCWVFAGICAGLGQYLGTTLTKKTIATFVSSFTPISMILVIGLSAMIVHDRIKKPR